MEKFKVVVVEASRHPSPAVNLGEVLHRIRGGGRLVGEAPVFLPENWLTREPLEEDEYLAVLDKLYWAGAHTLFAGLSYVRVGGGVRSRGYAVIDGRTRLLCEKVYPSRAVGERGRIEGGQASALQGVQGWSIGCVACVDVFYPELTRRLAAMGAHVVYNPAAITTDRLELWWSMLRARAAESIVYTVGVNTVGAEYPDGRITGGGSRVYSPAGLMVNPRVQGGLLLYELDPVELGRVRERWAFRDDLESSLAGLYA